MNFSKRQQRAFFWVARVCVALAGTSSILAGFSVIPKPGPEILGISAAVCAYLATWAEQQLPPRKDQR